MFPSDFNLNLIIVMYFPKGQNYLASETLQTTK